MITLHDKNETDFQKNGLGLLDNLIFNQQGIWELNDQFKISFEIPALTELAEHIKERNIVQAPVPFTERQLFRIYRIEKTLDSIHVEARHIFYDLLDNWIEDTKIVNQAGNTAIQQLLSKTQYTHKFIASSNIDTIASTEFARVNPIEALLDDGKDHTFLSRWGGELVRNNFRIEMLKRMGVDRGVKIEHKKDLLGYNATIDVSTIVTRIQPVGAGGLMLPERYVDSPRIDPDHPIIAEVSYQDIKAADGELKEDKDAVPIEQAYNMLREAAKAEFKNRHIDEPETVIEVDFVALHNTEQYQHFADLQEVRAGDTVTVSAHDHHFNITSRLIAFEFSLLKENQYTKTTLGNHVYDFTTSEPNVNDLRQRVEEAERTAVIASLAANGRNRNFFGSEDPKQLALDASVGDLYFREFGERKQMYRYTEVNGETYWTLVSDTENLDSVKKEVEETQNGLEEYKNDIDTSLVDLNTTIGSTFTSLDDTISDLNAISQKTQANVQKFQTTATDAFTAAKQSLSALTNIESNISSIKYDIDELTGTVALKASQTDLNTMTGKVKQHDLDISINAQGLKLKADQTSVNALSGRVTKLDSELIIQADMVKSKVSMAEVNGAIGNLEIGERNLVLKSGEKKKTNQYNFAQYIMSTPWEAGVDYYMIMKASASTTKSHIGAYANGGTFTLGSLVYDTKTDVWRGVLRTSQSTTMLQLFQFPNNSATMEVEWVKVVKGTKTSFDWSAAPEDMATASFVESEIKQTAENIKSTVSDLNGRVSNQEQTLDRFTKSLIDEKTGRLTKTEQTVEGLQNTVSGPSGLTSQFTQLNNAISLKVSSSDVTKAILDDKTIADTRNDNQLPKWYFANKPKQTVEEFKLRSVIGVPGSSTFGQLTTVVPWDGYSGGVIVQTFHSSDGTFQRKGNSSGSTWLAWVQIADREYVGSQISVLKDQINLRVTKGDMISQINIEAKKTLIESNQLILDANTVNITGKAFIPDAAISNISADKINTGRLDAGKISVINMDAESITSGTLRGGNMGINLNNSSIELRDPLTQNKLTLVQGRISFNNGTQGRNLLYHEEGLISKPYTSNSGTNNNSMLRLEGGGVGSYQYLQFSEGGTSGRQQRLEAVGDKMSVQVHPGGRFEVRAYGEAFADMKAYSYESHHSSGNWLKMVADRIEVPGDGRARNIYLKPNGTGIVSISDQNMKNFYNIRASTFLNSSSRKLKTQIEETSQNALDILNTLTIVEYNLKSDLEIGVDNRQIGLIAEDSLIVASKDGESIDTYRLLSYNTKAIQELSNLQEEFEKNIENKIFNYDSKIYQLEAKVTDLEQQIKELKGVV
ncbi:phage tail spike protein [Marinilactibacillus kalidii]|uniref:phage tail spike protein n=1 Tax=Marinilactibacillus kalidii TaxID=2820274 RepID=UPI001ABDD5F3|nr:phage tail spike protein [Marinilactibacillus kalidii]